MNTRATGGLRATVGIALVSALLAAGCTSALPGQSASQVQTQPRSTAATQANGGGVLAQVQAAMTQLVRDHAGEVVQIETGSGLGSGVIFDDKGDIVTNAHVVQGASSFSVVLADGRRLQARMVGTYTTGDVAVLKVDATGLKPATFGDSSELEVGNIVIAIGSPLGLTGSVTEGIVSATGRSVGERGGAQLRDLIQISAPINPGNSGGGLVDIEGHVVGIPTLGANGEAQGIGFAIPSNTVVDVANQLIQQGRVTRTNRAFLGVSLRSSQSGVTVSSVEPGGPADRAGIKAGSTITAIEGKATPSIDALSKVLAGLKPGQQVKVDLKTPEGGSTTITVTLGELPA